MGTLSSCAAVALSVCACGFAVAQIAPPAAQSAPAANVHHEANFDAERKQANEIFLAGKVLDALPLYEDLCRQDPAIAVFAERHGTGLFMKAGTLTDEKQKAAMIQQGMAELRRAQSLGDNSPLVQTLLAEQGKNFVGAVVSGVPLTVGYTYRPKPEAEALLKQAEADFAHNDWTTSVEKYKQAFALDPGWYTAALLVGDSYERLHDVANAGVWYQTAIGLDPDRETAYRYWGMMLYHAGDRAGAKIRLEQAVVAEPYGRPAMLGLQQWAVTMHGQLARPVVAIPKFAIVNGKLDPDPTLTTETGDGHASWLAYELARLAHGAQMQFQPIVAGSTDKDGVLHPTGYRHSLAEESESIHAMLADVRRKLDAGTVAAGKLEPSIKNLLELDKAGMIDCWIVLNNADGGVRADYPAFRKDRRAQLQTYIDHFMIYLAPPPAAAGQPSTGHAPGQ